MRLCTNYYFVDTNIYTSCAENQCQLLVERHTLFCAHTQPPPNKKNMVLSMQRWKGKVAVVTGASSGIGAAVVAALVKEGLCVFGLARRVERVEEISKTLTDQPGKLHAIKCDVSKEEDILAAFKQIKELGPIHILINNAAIVTIVQDASLSDGETEKWLTVLNTNLVGLCIATREAIRDMKANGVDGHIIHVNSIGGHHVPVIPTNMYPVSKHGLTAATEVLRQELVACKSKIKISGISPGIVDTEMTRDMAPEAMKGFIDRVPYLKADDISDGILYILSTPPHVQIHDVIIKPVGETL